MKDIELLPLPDGEASSFGSYTVFDFETLQAYARAAVEADRAQRVPEGWLNVLEDFEKKERSPFQAYLAAGLANELRAALLASTPAQPAQQEPSEAEMVCAEAYQVVGSLLSDLGLFETEAARKILDNLSEAHRVHQDVLPWESAAAHQEPPQQERKPMTDDAVSQALFWLDAALKCSNFHWDHDQRECAEAALHEAHQEPPQPVERKPMTDEIVRLAGVVLNEMPHPMTNWQSAAKKVCEAVAAIKEQTK